MAPARPEIGWRFPPTGSTPPPITAARTAAALGTSRTGWAAFAAGTTAPGAILPPKTSASRPAHGHAAVDPSLRVAGFPFVSLVLPRARGEEDLRAQSGRKSKLRSKAACRSQPLAKNDGRVCLSGLDWNPEALFGKWHIPSPAIGITVGTALQGAGYEKCNPTPQACKARDIQEVGRGKVRSTNGVESGSLSLSRSVSKSKESGIATPITTRLRRELPHHLVGPPFLPCPRPRTRTRHISCTRNVWTAGGGGRFSRKTLHAESRFPSIPSIPSIRFPRFPRFRFRSRFRDPFRSRSRDFDPDCRFRSRFRFRHFCSCIRGYTWSSADPVAYSSFCRNATTFSPEVGILPRLLHMLDHAEVAELADARTQNPVPQGRRLPFGTTQTGWSPGLF